jgi:hypothetical protein
MLDLLLRRGYWRRCCHQSHRWPYWRTCLRGFAYDMYCQRHNRTCWGGDCGHPRQKP